MRATITALLLTAACGLAQLPTPRPSTELTITQHDGARTMLSSYRGKVVVIQFLMTTCPHCQRLSQELTQLGAELGPDVQMLGVAFDNPGPIGAKGYIDRFRIGFPVAIADRNATFSYLGLNETQRIGVPQVVVIDRAGTVRAQTDALGGGELGSPELLKALLTDLLQEGVQQER